MKVSIYYGHGLNVVVNTTVAHAASKRYPISLMFGCAKVTVPDFPAFLECMWAGFCECSKHSFGEQMRRLYTATVVVDDGHIYPVWIRYDEESGGVRYGSIY